MIGEDGMPKPDAVMVVKFLRAHSDYLMTGKQAWPYVNSAAAIKQINDAAADMIEGNGALARDARLQRLEQALIGLVAHVRRKDPDPESMEYFIDQAETALSDRRGIK